jgi:hypothetical protein
LQKGAALGELTVAVMFERKIVTADEEMFNWESTISKSLIKMLVPKLLPLMMRSSPAAKPGGVHDALLSNYNRRSVGTALGREKRHIPGRTH